MDLNSNRIKFFLIILLCAGLMSCESVNYAPVQEANFLLKTPGYYEVKPGDSLYSIAWAFGKDYRDLAEHNHIPYPYAISPGQNLLVDYYEGAIIPHASPLPEQKPKEFSQPAPINQPALKYAKKPSFMRQPTTIAARQPSVAVTGWNWPAQGKIIKNFEPGNNSKGIDIAGRSGAPIYATAAGEVVYAGVGLRGYGKLLIIKHNSEYLSAYAHNSILLVKEGEKVKAKQKIAEMGNTEAKQVMLHFEIRKAGKPINPLKLLRTQQG